MLLSEPEIEVTLEQPCAICGSESDAYGYWVRQFVHCGTRHQAQPSEGDLDGAMLFVSVWCCDRTCLFRWLTEERERLDDELRKELFSESGLS